MFKGFSNAFKIPELRKKILITLEHANTVLEDVEVISAIAASRSEDIDGIIDNVSSAASDISGATANSSLLTTVGSVAKSAASIKGIFKESSDEEIRAAKKAEKAERRRERKSRRSAE